ncbi:FBOX [Musa troglodytarum]|uniref:FBOX n=1 Tax=Musa troglodytarum TaxID=320322 RepID=A0A9E7FAH2_9LILI|nr:FBOX [Musa troglodytarum]
MEKKEETQRRFDERGDHVFGKLPDHLLIEIFVRVPICEWSQVSCVNKHWAAIFRGESFWQTAIIRTWPFACQRKRWPGPIPRGSGRRSRDEAHELASEIWLAVINNLEENQHTFLLLKRLAQEGDFFLPFPYTRSYKVLCRVFEKLFTDFRDCLSREDYYDVLACAKSRFRPIPSTWLGGGARGDGWRSSGRMRGAEEEETKGKAWKTTAEVEWEEKTLVEIE